MSREILQDIIGDFSPDKFTRFFREKNRSFAPRQESFTHYNDEYFSDGMKLGEIKFSESEKIVVCAFKASQPLSERTGKKAQYEKGKKILKDTRSDAGIFIFYDKEGNFRFSLIYPKAIGNLRQWSNFRRFTYFVSREFTNKTFLQRIGDSDFSSLEKIKDSFSVEKVTKEFYEDIANWYFWAVQHSTFPKDAEEEENGRNIAVIRLITRMIFIWFMREKSLVPKNLFEEKSISAMLKEISPESSTYYQAILQNLFFATLSTKKDGRKFRSEIRGYKGYNPDFGNQNVFRFQELFKNPENLKDDFGEIPFLNGGLFECLDDKPNGIYIDGFTAVKKNQSNVPNILFFSGERKADLNAAYGTKSKTYKVRGLLDILSSFNFTIDENSPDDQDIALDPELLGRVFENLLASFNPETSTTARKATGSYYTPREIVDYMVSESLKAYFKTHLSDISDLDKKIEQLFSTGSEENPFDKSESKKIVELIESVRIVDPAVGSGAFPMGALNKLVFILNKVDPGNELWKQAQLSAADTIPDPRIKQDTKNRIEEFFKGKNADYGRKLYLIQKCIYGVDIQQIAVEIAKLRFFISLLVDEGIDKTKENWGIEPLPNLDFKIMQGNSLISEFLGIDFDNNNIPQHKKTEIDKIKLEIKEIEDEIKEIQKTIITSYNKKNQTDKNLMQKANDLGKKKSSFEYQLKILEAELTKPKNEEDGSLIKEFERKKIDYQNESDKDKKVKLKSEVEDLMIKIFESKVKKQKAGYFKDIEEVERKYSALPNKQSREEIIAKEKQKLSKKIGFYLENIEKQLREFTSKKKTRPFFPWKLYFAEVFEKGGFDIVIANPPYGNLLKTREKKSMNNTYTYSTFSDISSPFIERSFNLLKNQGNLVFIITFAITFSKDFSKSRELIANSFAENYIYTFDRDKCRIFKSMTQTVSIIKCFNKNSPNKKGILTSRMFRETPDIYEIDVSNSNNFLLPKLSSYNQKHRLPKIGEKLNRQILEKLLKFNDNVKTIIKNSGSKIWIRTSGNYWYNAFDKKPYDSVKISPLNVNMDFANVLIVLMNSSLFYFWFRIYGDGRDMNMDILESFPLPSIEKVARYKVLLNKIKVRFMYELFSVFDKERDRFITSNIKSEIDLLDLILCKYFYGLDYEEIKHILDYDLEIRGGNKLQKPFVEIVDKILAITKSSDYLENPAKKEEVDEYEKQIDQMVYKLYGLTLEEIAIIENSNKKN